MLERSCKFCQKPFSTRAGAAIYCPRCAAAPAQVAALTEPRLMPCITEISGYVEKLNRQQREFTLVPRILEWNKTSVSFAPLQAAQVQSWEGKLVRIHGRGYYEESAPMPRKLELHKGEEIVHDPTVSLLNLGGTMPNITNGKSVAEYLKDQREE